MASTALAVFFVLVGCCSNLFFLELLTKEDPGSGNLITFCQFLFITLEGTIFTWKFGRAKRNIAIKDYMSIVIMFFVTSVLNNYAFDFKVPMPLHMIFRSGSLLANMIMNIVFMDRKYRPYKYYSVLLITIGICICTLISGKDMAENNDQKNIEGLNDLVSLAIGVAMLTVALLVSAMMGIYQEFIYSRFGKHPREALFYTHLLPLPFFVLLSTNLWEHAIVAVNSPAIELPLLGLSMPRMLFYLACNVLTQYLCIGSVFVLTTECTSLTVNLILTLRKFTSLIFSILYFQNSFTDYHWIGSLFVFVGTISFTDVILNLTRRYRKYLRQSRKLATD